MARLARDGGGSEVGFALKALAEMEEAAIEASLPIESAASLESDRAGRDSGHLDSGQGPGGGKGDKAPLPDPLDSEHATLEVPTPEMAPEPA